MSSYDFWTLVFPALLGLTVGYTVTTWLLRRKR